MPNTLVHIGVQGLGNKLILKKIDMKWVFLGCIIPDIPWIFRHALIALLPGINLYDVTLYTSVQASLLFSILLSLAFALLSAKPRLVFGILAFNSIFHLLLDATEIKWGNGVFLLAPITWQLTSLEWVWPDDVSILILSLGGLVVGVWALMHPASKSIDIRFKPHGRLVAAFFLLTIYAFSPLALRNGPLTVDYLSITTLHETERRIGREVRMDRSSYQHRASGDVVITLANEPLRVIGEMRARSPQVTLIGEFVDIDAIRIHQLHEFHYPWRDFASYIGLGLIMVYWVVAFARRRRG